MIKQYRSWSFTRQCLGQHELTTEQVLAAVIGIYSAHPTAPLSFFARIPSMSVSDFHSMEREKRVLRIPAMRLTVFIVPRQTAGFLSSATIPPRDDPTWEKRYSQKGRAIPTESYPGWRDDILSKIQEPMTAKEIKSSCSFCDEILKPMLNRMAFEGWILRIGSTNLRSNTIQYVSTQAWLGEELYRESQKSALSWLAREYLRAFGPIRVKDFRWWAGVSASQAAQALGQHETISVEKNYLLLKEDLEDFESTSGAAVDSLVILPQWDCYTMGYAPDGRERFITSAMQSKLYGSLGATGGNSLGAVMVNGLVEGTWSMKVTGASLAVKIEMFESPSARVTTLIDKKFNDIASLFDVKKLSITL